MRLINYEIPGLLDLFKDIYELDSEYSLKGKSDQTSTSSDGRVQLGANSDSVLSMTSANFLFDNVNIFELDAMKSMSTSIEVIDEPKFTYNPTDIDTPSLEKSLPDIFNYIKECKSIFEDLAKDNIEDARSIYPIGCFKFKVIVSLRGKDILLLFNGLIENYLYSTFKSKDELLQDDAESIIKRDTLKAFMSNFMKYTYQASQKPSLIEDFLIQEKYYAYIKTPPIKYTFSLASISHGFDNIMAYGYNGNSLSTKVELLKKSISEDKEISVSSANNVMLTFGVSSNILTFMMLKLFGINFKIIAHQKYDILFSDKDNMFYINGETRTRYGVRITSMIKHNIDCRNIALNDVKTESNLSHPTTRYGMILTSQQIKYLIQIPISKLNSMAVLHNGNISSVMLEDAGNIITDIRQLGLGIESSFIKILH